MTTNAATFADLAHAPPREAVGFARKRAGIALGVKAVGSFLPGLTRKAFEKYGFSAATLITDWPTIAGTRACRLHGARAPEMAARRRACARTMRQAGRKGRPGATLVLRVDGAHARSMCSTRPARSSSASTPISAMRAVAELRILQAPVGEPLPPCRAAAAPPRRSR